MARYIDADKLLKEFEVDTSKDVMDISDIVFGAVTSIIEKQPTADVVEVKHGEWKRVRWVKCDDPDGGYWIVRCNQCSIPHFKEYNYCPSCGAKMAVSEMEITTEGGTE